MTDAEKLTRLMAFVRELAAQEICEDVGARARCDLGSGPYCECHPFDTTSITEARDLLQGIADPPVSEAGD